LTGERLARDYGKGYSVDNLESFRQFYLDYPRLISETASRNSMLPAISETMRRKSAVIPATEGDNRQPARLNPDLSWTHYVTLLRVKRQQARDWEQFHFPETPAAALNS
jgi:hypothetical protein